MKNQIELIEDLLRPVSHGDYIEYIFWSQYPSLTTLKKQACSRVVYLKADGATAPGGDCLCEKFIDLSRLPSVLKK